MSAINHRNVQNSIEDAPDQPLDYTLSNEKRRNREEVERAERRLTDLEIEANLAGVPPEWLEPEPEDAVMPPQGRE